jgi:FkbM family methyltransferase
MPAKTAAAAKTSVEKAPAKPKSPAKKPITEIKSSEQPSSSLPTTATAPKISPKTFHEAGFIRTKQCRYGMMSYITHDSYCGRSLDAYGEFSPGEAELFKQIIHPGSTVLDIGANIGIHTVLFAQLVGPEGRVIAFEPQRVIHQLLAGNVMINGHMNVDARRAAAGSAPGKLLVPRVNYTVEGNYGCVNLGQWDSGEEVAIETVDGFNLPACHFMKIDVEGMELSALQGARATILRHRPVLYVENDRADNSRALIEYLFSLNYRLYWHVSPYYKSANFFGNSENLFPGIVSVNLVCLPHEMNTTISGAREVLKSDENWLELFGKKEAEPLPA